VKFLCTKENKIVYPHPGLARVANFDFHQCAECDSEKCTFIPIRKLPYEAFMLMVRWWTQCPVDDIHCRFGWTVSTGFGGCQKDTEEQQRLGRLHYSLPPYLNARVGDRGSRGMSRRSSSPIVWPWWMRLEGLFFRFVDFPLRLIAKGMRWWKKRLMGKHTVLQQKCQPGTVIEQRTRFRVGLLEEAIKEAKQKYPSYKTDVPHWKNSKLRQEVEAAGEVYDV